MSRQRPATLLAAASLVVVSMALTAQSQDRSTVTSPNGIAFAEFAGYESWQVIGPSQSNDVIKVIVGNPVMIKAYTEGFPANNRPIPDGAVMAKIAWSRKDNALLPGAAMVPDTLRKVQFMVKDARRFPDTDGWGYADFTYDTTSRTFKAMGSGPGFARAACHQCHTGVKARDFVFTDYAPR